MVMAVAAALAPKLSLVDSTFEPFYRLRLFGGSLFIVTVEFKCLFRSRYAPFIRSLVPILLSFLFPIRSHTFIRGCRLRRRCYRMS